MLQRWGSWRATSFLKGKNTLENIHSGGSKTPSFFLGNQIYGDENPRTQWRFIAGDIDSIDGGTQHFLIVRTDYSTSFTSGWWYTYPSEK